MRPLKPYLNFMLLKPTSFAYLGQTATQFLRWVRIEYDMPAYIIHVNNKYVNAPISTLPWGFYHSSTAFWGFASEWAGSRGGCKFMHSSHKQGPKILLLFLIIKCRQKRAPGKCVSASFTGKTIKLWKFYVAQRQREWSWSWSGGPGIYGANSMNMS